MENIKRRKICTLDDKISNNPVLNVEFLPNEILMNIFSNLNINDLYKCAKVSRKFRHISHDKSFWKCVNLYNQRVSCEFITQIIKLGTEYLNLQGAFLMDNVDTDLPRENNLKCLNLAESAIDDQFLAKLLRSSKSLEKLSLAGMNTSDQYYKQSDWNHSMLQLRTTWYLECVLPNAKMLTTLDLRRKSKKDCSVHFVSIKEIILVCDQLREANFEWQKNIEDDLDFFANNLSTKIEKLNISYIGFHDQHLVKLLKRCKKITELDLYCCNLHEDVSVYGRNNTEQRTLMAISENLSQSLVKLQLPDHSIIYPGFLNSLPRLKYLWHQGRYCCKSKLYCSSKYSPCATHQMKSQFPQIAFELHLGNAQIANCANEYFEPKLGFWELKCTNVDLDFPKIE